MGPRTRKPRQSPPAAPPASAGDAAWNQSLYQLHQFHRERGHCEVPLHEPAWRKLAIWVAQQRDFHQRGKLPRERQAALDQLGFNWESARAPARQPSQHDARWEQRFGELLAFKRLTGHTNVSKTAPGNVVLWHWRNVQREFRTKGKLSAARIARLEAIGFVWAEPGRRSQPHSALWDEPWEQRFAELAQFKERFGHCRVRMSYQANVPLAAWVNAQRVAHNKGTVRADRAARLEALGFEWSLKGDGAYAALWEQRFNELVAFKDLTGHTRVTERPPGDKVLAHWREVQREFRRKGKLSAERIARLDAVGFEWQKAERFARSWDAQWDEQWERMFQQLAAFKERFGHCAVSSSWTENLLLGQWVMRHRAADRCDELRPDRRARLDALGFVWDIKASGHFAKLWESRYARLREFVETHGHARLPMPPHGDKLLWSWGHTQRDLYRRGLLPPGRTARLEALGFEWSNAGPSPLQAEAIEAAWEAKFQLLVEFKERCGHLRVPAGTPVLSNWTRRQRRHIREGTITAGQQARLAELGFPPPLQPGVGPAHDEYFERKWAANFEELRQFQERHGHSCVTKHSREHARLGLWLQRQRHDLRVGKMTAEHEARLAQLGFPAPAAPESPNVVPR